MMVKFIHKTLMKVKVGETLFLRKEKDLNFILKILEYYFVFCILLVLMIATLLGL